MYNLPSSTLVNRVIPKKTLVEQLGANTRMKDHFTNDVIKVELLAKLSPGTLNVAEGKNVQEISVFFVPLKIKDCSAEIFTFIDTLMPRHTLFILQKDESLCLLLNYKERIESEGKTEKKFCITKTYRSSWTDADDLTIHIEGLDMDAIYETLVRQVAGTQIIAKSDDLRSDVELSAAQEALLKQLDALEKKEVLEVQPQKKFAIHKQIIELKNKL